MAIASLQSDQIMATVPQTLPEKEEDAKMAFSSLQSDQIMATVPQTSPEVDPSV